MSPETPSARANGHLTEPTSSLESLAGRRAGLRPVALGELHSLDACAYCGLLSSETELVPTVIVMTNAPGMRCRNPVTCLVHRLHGAS